MNEATTQSYWLTGDAFVFIGLLIQAAAIIWVWTDWKMSQYQHADWRKAHRKSETETLRSLADAWSKFGGPATVRGIEWDRIGSADLEDMAKEFPARGDEDELKKRKIAALTPRYGIGPSTDELLKMRGQLEYLALIRRGVADYRTFMRRKTFQTALALMLVGLAVQALGSWPTRWVYAYENEPRSAQEDK